jgi:glutaryl-CoA dehydrogenase
VTGAHNHNGQLAPFSWEDPFLLEDQLREDERMIRDAARSLCAGPAAAPRHPHPYREETTDPAIFPRNGRAWALLGVTIPEEYGGLGAGSYVAYGLVAREVERVDSAAIVQHDERCSRRWSCIRSTPMASEAQRQQIPCRNLRRGELDRLLWPDRTRCRFRPGGHEDPSRSERPSNGYRPERVRRCGFPTAPIADVFVVWAKSEARDGNKIRGFVLDKGTKGLSDTEDRRQALAARLDHRRDRARQDVEARRGCAAA